jgi:DNA-binding transcriptional regulator YiaG
MPATAKKAAAPAATEPAPEIVRQDPGTGLATIGPKPAAKAKAKAPAKPMAAKPAAKPKAERKPIERVPAAEVEALLKELGMSKTQLAKACGASASLVSEWVGKGRGQLVNRDRWAGIQKAARTFAKGIK